MTQPFNPYESFIVKASAGSGKTYQLSKRFLHLVSAHTPPGQILTITFTKKAALEMRERILNEASKLLYQPEEQKLFDQAQQEFFSAYCQNKEFALAPPLSAEATAKQILATSGQLRIATIDSVFFEWVKRFPFETQIFSQEKPDAKGLRLLDEDQLVRLEEEAWQNFCSHFFEQVSDSAPQDLWEQGGLNGLRNRLLSAQDFASYLWLSQQLRGGELPLHAHPHPLALSDHELMPAISEAVLALSKELKGDMASQVQAAVASRNLALLLASGLISKTLNVSGTFFRKEKRQRFSSEIDHVETCLRNHFNERALKRLNHWGEFLLTAQAHFDELKSRKKSKHGILDFDDLAKGCFHLFLGRNTDSYGARFLIHKNLKHLMCDEFQDTSRLQWSIFASIAEELLSGQSLHEHSASGPSTVFMVGDDKQSIYGFREADPSILGDAESELATKFGTQSFSLTKNYRSASTLMNYVNAVFTPYMKDFPQHVSAEHCPDEARIQVSDLFASREEEAEYVAKSLKEALYGEISSRPKVFDKEQKIFRPLEPSDCVLLYRFSTHAPSFAKALEKYSIPFVSEQSQNFFNSSAVSDLCALMRYFSLPSDVLSLITLLKSPFFQVADANLMTLLNQRNRKDSASLLANLAQALPSVYEKHQGLATLAHNHAPHAFLAKALHWCKVFDFYATHYAAAHARELTLNAEKLVELSLHLEKQGYVTLPSQMMEMDRLKHSGSMRSAVTDTNAVTLMTIHKAKGLEWAMTILVDTARAWEKRDLFWLRGKDEAGAPGMYYVGSQKEQPQQDKNFDQIFERVHEEQKRESLRLLYVALTRAKQYLLITGTGKDAGADSFYQMTKQALAKSQQRLGTDTRVSRDPLCWGPLASEAPASATLYGSGSCPRQFPTKGNPERHGCLSPKPAQANDANFLGLDVKTIKPHSLIRQGASKGRGKDYGTLVHGFLDSALRNGSHEQLVTNLPKAGDDVSARAIQEISELANTPVWQEIFAGAEEVLSEQSIAHYVVKSGELIQGKIDLLVKKNAKKEIWVIDYKTAAFDEDSAASYRPQLTAYRNAVAEMFPEYKVVSKVLFTSPARLVEV